MSKCKSVYLHFLCNICSILHRKWTGGVPGSPHTMPWQQHGFHWASRCCLYESQPDGSPSRRKAINKGNKEGRCWGLHWVLTCTQQGNIVRPAMPRGPPHSHPHSPGTNGLRWQAKEKLFLFIIDWSKSSADGVEYDSTCTLCTV